MNALKPTGIQYVRDNIEVQQTGGHRNYEVQFLLSGMTQVFQDRNYNVQKILSEVLPNQQSHQKYSALV